MMSGKALLVALLAVLVLVVVLQMGAPAGPAGGPAPEGGPAADPAAGPAADQEPGPARNSAAHMQSQLRDLEAAQLRAWEAAPPGEPWAPEDGGEQYRRATSQMDYQSALTDLVADERMRANHAAWTAEVAPKSHMGLKVDTIDEAAAMSSYNGWGINAFRMAAPAQRPDALFVTEMDGPSMARNATSFRLGGR